MFLAASIKKDNKTVKNRLTESDIRSWAASCMYVHCSGIKIASEADYGKDLFFTEATLIFQNKA
jgi:hypothetical protein